MTAKAVPPRPNLAQYRKQAKDLLKAHASGTLAALARIQSNHPRLAQRPLDEIGRSPLLLADAQLVVAREHGFKSWPSFQNALRDRLQASVHEIFPDRIQVQEVQLAMQISGWKDAHAIAQFVVAGNIGIGDPGLTLIRERLNEAGICTVMCDLLTESEAVEDAIDELLRFDLRLLAQRAAGITAWIDENAYLARLPLGYVGCDTGAAAAVVAALDNPKRVRALVSNAGRPDLAGPWLGRIGAPMLAIVGDQEAVAFGFTKAVMQVISSRVPHEVKALTGATHPFAGEHAVQAAALTCEWLQRYLDPESERAIEGGSR